jgi:hypothetical protein
MLGLKRRRTRKIVDAVDRLDEPWRSRIKQWVADHTDRGMLSTNGLEQCLLEDAGLRRQVIGMIRSWTGESL